MRKKVLFVGSFIQKAKDGSVGGQMYACKSLVGSSLSKEVEWILLDTTGLSVPPPPVYVRAFGAVKRLIQFVFLLLKKRPDYTLIFSGNGTSFVEKGLMAIVANGFRVKVLFSPRAGALIQETNNNRFFQKFARAVIKRCDYVICQGSFWKEYMTRLLPEFNDRKYVVIPNWMDLSGYPVKKANCGNNDQNKQELKVLFMGWIQESKGVYDLLRALEGARFEGARLHFTFLGDGPARADLVERFEGMKERFGFESPGWVYGADKMKHLAEADIFILPSHSEGLPNSLMEAMASGVPGIATRVGAVEDLIEDGVTGLIVAPGDHQALQQSLETLVRNPELRCRISKNARRKIEANHSIDSAVSKLKAMLT